jgi:3-polyprenyl-4-hydroxybenzoate decarboxylase
MNLAMKRRRRLRLMERETRLSHRDLETLRLRTTGGNCQGDCGCEENAIASVDA